LGTSASPAPRLVDVPQQRDSRELRVEVAFSALLDGAVVASLKMETYATATRQPADLLARRLRLS